MFTRWAQGIIRQSASASTSFSSFSVSGQVSVAKYASGRMGLQLAHGIHSIRGARRDARRLRPYAECRDQIPGTWTWAASRGGYCCSRRAPWRELGSRPTVDGRGSNSSLTLEPSGLRIRGFCVRDLAGTRNKMILVLGTLGELTRGFLRLGPWDIACHWLVALSSDSAAAEYESDFARESSDRRD